MPLEREKHAAAWRWEITPFALRKIGAIGEQSIGEIVDVQARAPLAAETGADPKIRHRMTALAVLVRGVGVVITDPAHSEPRRPKRRRAPGDFERVERARRGVDIFAGDDRFAAVDRARERIAMAGAAAGERDVDIRRCSVLPFVFDATVCGFAIRNVESVRVAQDHGGTCGIECGQRKTPIRSSVMPTEFARTHALGVQIGDALVSLQAVKLGGLRRPKAVAGGEIKALVARGYPAEFEAWRQGRVAIGAIRGTVVEAARDTARAAVFGGVSVAHAIVVSVAGVIAAYRDLPIEMTTERTAELRLQPDDPRVD
ncbi:MAG: hypothetical protein EBZ40_05510 [Gammaproteobacteria bacterium]|nr:hypothetical protein [Gammaproteobacteria bacterium]